MWLPAGSAHGAVANSPRLIDWLLHDLSAGGPKPFERAVETWVASKLQPYVPMAIISAMLRRSSLAVTLAAAPGPVMNSRPRNRPR